MDTNANAAYIAFVRDQAERFQVDLEHTQDTSGLVHPDAAFLFEEAQKYVTQLSDELATPCTIGGSSVVVDGRTTLLACEAPDWDVRIWAKGTEEMQRLESALSKKYQIQFRNQGGRETNTGPFRYAETSLWISSPTGDGQISINLGLLIRDGATPQPALAERRLHELGSEALGLYLAVKSSLRGTDNYKKFKHAEAQWWDRQAEDSCKTR